MTTTATGTPHATVGRVQLIKSKLEEHLPQIAGAAAEWINPERLIYVALTAATRQPELQECTVQSLLLAVMESGQLGLLPDGREGALVKYGDRAQFQPMAQGIVALMHRSPGVAKIEARAVLDGDHFEWALGLEPKLVHEPRGPTKDRPVIAVYAIVWWLNGAPPTFEVMDRDQIEEVRAASRAPNSPAWTRWYGEMARKSAVKRASKYVDLRPEAAAAIRLDHAVETGEPIPVAALDPQFQIEGIEPVVAERAEARLAELSAELETLRAERAQASAGDEPAPEEAAVAPAAPAPPSDTPGTENAAPTAAQAASAADEGRTSEGEPGPEEHLYDGKLDLGPIVHVEGVPSAYAVTGDKQGGWYRVWYVGDVGVEPASTARGKSGRVRMKDVLDRVREDLERRATEMLEGG